MSIVAGASDGPLRPRAPKGAEIHILSPERRRSAISRLLLGGQMAPVARTLAPDAVFIPGNFHFMLGGALRAALPNAAIVAKASNPVWSDNWLPTALARALIARGTNGIDRIVAMSPALELEVARYVRPDRVAVIDDPFLDEDAIIGARSGNPEGGLKLLTVARLEAQKDPQLAVAVIAALRASGHEASLTILGAGPLQSAVQAEIDRAGLGDHIHLPGYIADPAPYYRDADLLLMTSRFEGVPAVIGEALVRGLPFVATDCSAWLTRLAADHPALGTVVPDRLPGKLADALVCRASLPFPSAVQIEAGISRHRLGPAAQAYLDLFDSLARN